MIIGLWAERGEVGAVASVLLPPAKGLSDASVGPERTVLLLLRCERWNIRSGLTCPRLPLAGASLTGHFHPIGPSRAFILPAVCF